MWDTVSLCKFSDKNKTMKQYLIVTALLLVIGWLLYDEFFRPVPTIQPQVDELTEAIQVKQLQIDSLSVEVERLESKMTTDSLKFADAKMVYEEKISRLTGKLRSIDTSKSGEKELDSLIIVLYGKN